MEYALLVTIIFGTLLVFILSVVALGKLFSSGQTSEAPQQDYHLMNYTRESSVHDEKDGQTYLDLFGENKSYKDIGLSDHVEEDFGMYEGALPDWMNRVGYPGSSLRTELDGQKNTGDYLPFIPDSSNFTRNGGWQFPRPIQYIGQPLDILPGTSAESYGMGQNCGTPFPPSPTSIEIEPEENYSGDVTPVIG